MDNEYTIIMKLVLSSILGGLIGLERESVNKFAGFRTHILVCVGSALIMLVSEKMYYDFAGETNIDPGRIAAQVVSGIGFLGAGTILREGATVKGLTTAASLWVVAGVGLAVGSGFYFAASAATGIIFMALIYLGKVERQIAGRKSFQLLRITTDDTPGQLGKIGSYLGEKSVNIQRIELNKLADHSKMLMDVYVTMPGNLTFTQLLSDLSEVPGISHLEHAN